MILSMIFLTALVARTLVKKDKLAAYSMSKGGGGCGCGDCGCGGGGGTK